MSNPDVRVTLREAVDEVLALLTGLDLSYQPEQDRFQVITRFLNMALRRNALDLDWSYYASTEVVGVTTPGMQAILLRNSVRPRIMRDDAVVLVKGQNQNVIWASFLPRESLSKYRERKGLWVSIVRDELQFSRPLNKSEAGLTIKVPVLREPRMFRLPEQPEDPNVPSIPVPDTILGQEIDFDRPDLIIARAAYMYAQTDPVMQPRAQVLEAEYKDLYYQLVERDEKYTDAPYINTFNVPISSDIYGPSDPRAHRHPHSDERYR